MHRARGRAIVLAIALLGTGACATYRDQLARAESAFDRSDHERTLALLRDLEPDIGRLPIPERARYAYVRGMTDYRVGYRADARHWLALASAYEHASPGVLPVDWKRRTAEALDELDAVVRREGMSALASRR